MSFKLWFGLGSCSPATPFGYSPGGEYHNVYFISDDSHRPSVKKVG